MKSGDSLAIHPYQPAALLQVTGSDASTFLQGQFTQDMRLVAPGKAAYGLFLDQKGRVIADAFIVGDRTEPLSYWIFSYGSPADRIRERLDAYIIADDVAIEDRTAQWSAISLLGPGAGARLASVPPPGLLFPGRRCAAENWEWVFPRVEAASSLEALAGLERLSSQALERLRIEDSIPAVPTDIGPRDLPNEGALEAAAISYAKGCYLGQEIMARLKSRGRLRRRLIRVRGTGSFPIVPAPLWRGALQAGELRSAVEGDSPGSYEGLAMMTAVVARADPSGSLSLEQGGPPTLAERVF